MRLVLAAVAALGALAAAGGCGSPPAPICRPLLVGDDACVLPAVARDVSATPPMSWADTETDVAQKCNVPQPSIAQSWATHQAAEVLEGFVPRPSLPPIDGGTQ